MGTPAPRRLEASSFGNGTEQLDLSRDELSEPVRGEDPLEENPNDAHNRRTLRPYDAPQNCEDAAALKLLAAVDRQPRVETVRIVFLTSGKGAEEIAYLELRSTDLPEGVSAANLYARIELPLATIFETPVEELTALLKRRLVSQTAITRSAETPPRTTLMAN